MGAYLTGDAMAGWVFMSTGPQQRTRLGPNLKPVPAAGLQLVDEGRVGIGHPRNPNNSYPGSLAAVKHARYSDPTL